MSFPKNLNCTLSLDIPPEAGSPATGDFIVTEGAKGVGSAYLILSVRKVERRTPARENRFKMQCQRGTVDDTRGATVWVMRWYSRDRKTPHERTRRHGS